MSNDEPTQRMIPAPLAVLAAAGALVVGVLLGSALGGSDDGSSISLSIPSVSPGSAAATTSPSGATPTASPEGTGSVSQGQASLSLSGGVNSTVTFGRLAAGAAWSPPPGEIALVWRAPGEQDLRIDGPSFTSQIATDATHTLSFTVDVDGSPIAFRSAAGECTVTISPALPTQMGGTFLCTDLASADDTVSVNAQGSFSATG